VLVMKIFGTRREGATEGRTSLYGMGGACGIHGQQINAFRVLVGKPRNKGTLGRPKGRRKDKLALVYATKQYWMYGSTHS
jgi:hypothetical protein